MTYLHDQVMMTRVMTRGNYSKKTATEGGEPTLEFGLRGTGNLKRFKQRATVTEKIETFADLDEWAAVHAMYSDAKRRGG